MSIAAEALADMPATKPKKMVRKRIVRDGDESMNS